MRLGSEFIKNMAWFGLEKFWMKGKLRPVIRLSIEVQKAKSEALNSAFLIGKEGPKTRLLPLLYLQNQPDLRLFGPGVILDHMLVYQQSIPCYLSFSSVDFLSKSRLAI